MAQENLMCPFSSRMVAEPVFDHGSTICCVGEPSEADGGSVGYGTTRSTVAESAQQMVGTQPAGIEKSFGATGLVGAKETGEPPTSLEQLS